MGFDKTEYPPHSETVDVDGNALYNYSVNATTQNSRLEGDASGTTDAHLGPTEPPTAPPTEPPTNPPTVVNEDGEYSDDYYNYGDVDASGDAEGKPYCFFFAIPIKTYTFFEQNIF